MLAGFLQFIQNARQFLRTVNEARLQHDFAKIDLTVLRHGLQKMIHMNDTDNVIDRAFIDRQPRMCTGEGHPKDGLPVPVHVQRFHIHTGGHRFIRGDILEVQRGRQKFRTVRVDDAFVLGGVDDGLQFFRALIRVRLFRLFDPRGQKMHQFHDHKGHWPEQDPEEGQEAGRRAGHPGRLGLRHDLRNGLAENNDEDGNDRRGQRVHAVRAGKKHHAHRCKRARRDIYEVVADEDRGKTVVEVLGALQRALRLLVALFGFIFQTHLVTGRQGHLRTGEVSGQHDTQYDAQKHKDQDQDLKRSHFCLLSPPSGISVSGSSSLGSTVILTFRIRLCRMSVTLTSRL